MGTTAEVDQLLRSWRRIPREIEKTLTGPSKADIESRKRRDHMSLHETIHHIAEANIVAASMIIAAIGKDGAEYDWTWLYPDLGWVKRMGYAKAPIKPVIKILNSLNEHIANLVRTNPKVLKRKVTVFDTPGGKKYTMTVEEIMNHEVTHAIEHLKEAARGD